MKPNIHVFLDPTANMQIVISGRLITNELPIYETTTKGFNSFFFPFSTLGTAKRETWKLRDPFYEDEHHRSKQVIRNTFCMQHSTNRPVTYGVLYELCYWPKACYRGAGQAVSCLWHPNIPGEELIEYNLVI